MKVRWLLINLLIAFSLCTYSNIIHPLNKNQKQPPSTKQKFSWKVVSGKVIDENGNPLKWVIK